MTRTERLLELLQVLRNKRLPVTARSLATDFAVSERTIYRDMATLVAQGAAIAGEGGVGYVLREDFFLPPLAFDREEAAAIMLGLRFVLRRGDPVQVVAAESARGKLAAVAPDGFSIVDAVVSPLLVGPARSRRVETLQTVRTALRRERRLAIDYVDTDGTESRRTVCPVAIGWFEDHEILAAWCETRDAFRHFRVDRIVHAEIIDARPPLARSALLARYRKIEPGISL